MASQSDVVNMALTMLGEVRIMSLDDASKPAREAKAVYDITLDALLAAYNWSFAKDRTTLASLSTAPAFGYDYQFTIPGSMLRIISIADYYVGLDLSDYKTSIDAPFSIEGRKILCSIMTPLPVIYVKRITDVTQMTPNFIMAFAAKLAMVLAEPLTQSDSKYAKAERAYTKEIATAIRTNAIEMPPQKLPDDEWLMSRL